jgi:hypothetical protein
MEKFGIGPLELVFAFLILLMVIGPGGKPRRR